jgi:hypothetical protein
MLTSGQKERFRQRNADREELAAQATVGRAEQATGRRPTFKPGLPLTFQDDVYCAKQWLRLDPELRSAELPGMLALMGITLEDFAALAEIDLQAWPPEWL